MHESKVKINKSQVKLVFGDAPEPTFSVERIMIESPFSHARKVMRNVKRWRSNSNQAQRWTTTALLEAEKRFRAVNGYRSMSVLKSAIEGEHMKQSAKKQYNAACVFRSNLPPIPV